MEVVKIGGGIDAATSRTFSDALWKDCPMTAIREGTVNGWYDENDFTKFYKAGTQTSVIGEGEYLIYNTGNGSGKIDAEFAGPTAFTPGGIVSNLTGADADQGVMASRQAPFSILQDGTYGQLWFEARIAQASIATNAGQLFIGLAENNSFTFGAAQPLGDANAVANNGALIGFTRLENGQANINTSYTDRATSWTHVKTSAYTTLAANTWLKVGMKFDPNDSTNTVQFWFNGVKNATALSKATLAATTNLKAAALGFCWAFFAEAGGSTTSYIDWYRVYQLATPK